MYSLFFEILLSLYNYKPVSNNAITNKLKNEAILAFYQKKYSLSEQSFKKVAKIELNEPEVLLNLAATLYEQNKYTEAQKIYKSLENSTDVKVSVQASFRLGLINFYNKDTLLAITNFENSLKKDFNNKASRYNLELLKKQFKGKNQSGYLSKHQSKTIEAKSDASKILDPKSNKSELLARLTKINMTESQARNIFDAIGKNELKYLHQKKHKSEDKQDNYQSW